MRFRIDEQFIGVWRTTYNGSNKLEIFHILMRLIRSINQYPNAHCVFDMWIMVLAVVAFLLMCTLSNGLRPSNRIVVFRSKYSELYSTSIGSDALVRPEDENSPEFKEYLKALLQMQVIILKVENKDF